MIAVVVFLLLLAILIFGGYLFVEGGAVYDEGRMHARSYSGDYYNTNKGVLAWLYDRGFDWKDKSADTATKNAQRRNAKTGNKEKI